jgi:hypothetical protein
MILGAQSVETGSGEAVRKRRWAPQISLFAALVIMLLLSAIVGLGVKVHQLQERNRALQVERENLEIEKNMLEYSIRKYKAL